MNVACECQSNDFSRDFSYSDDTSDTKNVKTVVIDFGTVQVLGSYVKTFTVDDDVAAISSFRIKRDPDVHSLYRVFSFNTYEGIVKENEKLHLKITYNPILAFEENVDRFEYVDSSLNVIRIITKGTAEGPLVSVSATELEFVITAPKKRCRETIELKNSSVVPAKFIFDCSKDRNLFIVEPRHGTINKMGHIFLKITFAPKAYGYYSQQLSCLVWNHDPVIVNVAGIYTKNPVESAITFYRYPLPFEAKIGYGAYMGENYSRKNHYPPVVLDSNVVDFGRVVKVSPATTFTQSVGLTNRMRDSIEVKWPTVITGSPCYACTKNTKIFYVKPRCFKVLPGQTAILECSFTPSENHSIYSDTLTAQIYWNSYAKTSPRPSASTSWNVPLNARLTLQGVTFSEEETILSNVRILPSRVTFPPCFPGATVYQNFQMKNMGCLPVSYKLIPPKETNVIMKPLLGIIEDFVIVYMQLKTEKYDEKYYEEEWTLELNGNTNRLHHFLVRGQTGIPSVVIGTNNVIEFDTTQPGSVSVLYCTIKNTSCFRIRYEMVKGEHNFIDISPCAGDLAAYDESVLTCSYTANMCAPKLTLHCKLHAMQKMNEYIGEVYQHTFTAHTPCSYSQLCSTPPEYDFGSIRWGCMLTTSFHVFNFGESAVQFKLSCSRRSHNRDSFSITPSCGEVKPKDKVEIHLEGRAVTVGEHSINISYDNNLSENIVEGMVDEGLLQLFKFQYFCAFPLLQVEEISEHTFGQLFSKDHLWHCLKITSLNKLFKSISADETKQLELTLPESEERHRECYVTMLVRNTSIYDVEVDLKRKKLCECTMKEVKKTFNSTEKVFDCPHRDMLRVELSDTMFYANSYQFLTITVKYTIPGTTRMAYTLDLSDGRIVQLNIDITVIPKGQPKISAYSDNYQLSFKNVYVGRRVGPIQVFWIYNNSSQTAKYKADITEILRLCRSDGFRVIEFLNPVGEVEPSTAVPLMVRFHPIEVKMYQVGIPIELADESKILLITGQGMASRLKQPFTIESPQLTQKCRSFPVALSLDSIIISPLCVWCTTERILFIKNLTKDKIILFQWEKPIVNGVLAISTKPNFGILRPNESLTIMVLIKAFNEAAMVNIVLPCMFIDYTQLYLHKKRLTIQEEELKELRKLFVIREDGTEEIATDSSMERSSLAPMPQFVSLSVYVNIVHFKDDFCLTARERFMSTPQEVLDVNVDNILKKNRSPKNPLKKGEYFDIDVAKRIVEQLISDFVFSSLFQETLQNCSMQQPRYYSQFQMDTSVKLDDDDTKLERTPDTIRDMEIKKLFSRPSLPVLSETMKQLIMDGLHQSCKLVTQFSRDADIVTLDKEVEDILKICDLQCDCQKN